MSITQAIVKHKQAIGEMERFYKIAVGARRIYKILMAQYTTDEQEAKLRTLLVTAWGGDTELFTDAFLRSITKIYGDIPEMYRDNRLLYGVPYWNPTNTNIVVSQLGIYDSSGKNLITSIPPGEIVMVPHPYTLGGKLSSVYCIAPQLLPKPQKGPDYYLDLQPTTYNEWCSFNSLKPTSCCQAHPVWSTVKDKYIINKIAGPVCSKCGKRAN